jgi:hypothetical protein
VTPEQEQSCSAYIEDARKLGITAVLPASGEPFRFWAILVDKRHQAAARILNFDVRMTDAERDAVLAARGAFFGVLISRPRTFLQMDLLANVEGVVHWRDTVFARMEVNQRVPILWVLALDKPTTQLVMDHSGFAAVRPEGNA